jgi:hypothetical protein
VTVWLSNFGKKWRSQLHKGFDTSDSGKKPAHHLLGPKSESDGNENDCQAPKAYSG